ncbi:MAG: HlyD family efflux transporter periplasmic adaptor subunit [Pseudomonadota bacterium]
MALEQSSSYSANAEAAPIGYCIRAGAEFTSSTDPETGAEKFFVKDRQTDDLFHLGAEEFFICQWLDGTASFSQIQSAFLARFGKSLSRDQFEAMLRELSNAGLLAEIDSRPSVRNDNQPKTLSASPQNVSRGFYLSLFDPSPLLAALIITLGALRQIPLLLVPGGVISAVVLFSSQFELAADISGLGVSIRSFITLLMTVLFCSFVAKLTQGAVAKYFGADVRDFGLRMALGFIPQFQIDGSSVTLLNKRAKLWVYGAPLLARLALFVFGTTLWAIFRESSDALANAFLMVAQVGIWSFIFTSIPILPNDGYLWMSTLIDQPNVLDRAARVLEMRLKGRQLPAALSDTERRALTAYGVAALLIFVIGLSLAFILAGSFLEQRLGGAGIVLMLVAVGVITVWFSYIWRNIQHLRNRQSRLTQNPASRKIVSMRSRSENPAGGNPIIKNTQRAASAYSNDAGSTHDGGIPTSWIVMALLGVLLGALALIPYRFDAGGDFIILPTVRVEVRTRIDGVVEKIHVQEGDFIEEGQPIAELAVWEEKRDLEVAKASLKKAEAELRLLEAGASAEEIAASKARVRSAQVRADISTREYERMRELGDIGVISDRQRASFQGEFLKNKADLEAAEANLERVEAGASPNLLDAARAEVSRLNAQISFLQQQVDAAVVVAPISGRIVSDNLELQLGSYLTVGGLLTVVEDSAVAQAQILVPETSIAEVEVGDSVRLKPWGYSAEELGGTVTAIAPAAETTKRGQYIRVKTNIDNSLGILKPQMTGYAKIDGATMSVLEAYTRIYVRFFRIELWSWIP